MASKATRHEVPLPDKYIVELEPSVWLDTGDGDPPRTLREENAHEWSLPVDAAYALEEARQYRKFADAKIVPVPQSITISNTTFERQPSDDWPMIQNAKRTCEEFDKRETLSHPKGMLPYPLLGADVQPGHLVIIDDADNAQAAMIALVTSVARDDTFAAKYLYKKEGMKGLHVGGDTWNACPLDTFGVKVWTDGKYYEVTQYGEGEAEYADGKPRQWTELGDSKLRGRKKLLQLAIETAQPEMPF